MHLRVPKLKMFFTRFTATHPWIKLHKVKRFVLNKILYLQLFIYLKLPITAINKFKIIIKLLKNKIYAKFTY